MENKKRICTVSLSVFTAVWSVLSVILMLQDRSRGGFGYTGAMDCIIRMVLILLTLGCSLGAMAYLIVESLRPKDADKAVGKAFSLLGIAELLILAVAVISLIREFQTSMRLFEDFVYILLSLVVAVIILFVGAFKGNGKKVFTTSLVAVIVLASVILLESIFFAEGALRTIDFTFVAQRIAAILPLATCCVSAKLLLNSKAD